MKKRGTVSLFASEVFDYLLLQISKPTPQATWAFGTYSCNNIWKLSKFSDARIKANQIL